MFLMIEDDSNRLSRKLASADLALFGGAAGGSELVWKGLS